LKAHAAGETVEGVTTIAAPVMLSVLGVSDALKLVQIPSFLLLPGALFLLTCELIWRISKSPSDFSFAFPTPSFWLVAITLSMAAALLYPEVTGWFGARREYVSSFTFFDVLVVWFASIILAVPAYAITAIGHNRWIASRAAAKERDRQRRELSESDEPLLFLRKLIAKDVVPKGQIFPTVTIESGGHQQVVLKSEVTMGESCWIMPRAGIRSTRTAEDTDWKEIDQALESATDPSAVKALLDVLAQQDNTIEATWTRGLLITGPKLWLLAELGTPGDDLPLFDRE